MIQLVETKSDLENVTDDRKKKNSKGWHQRLTNGVRVLFSVVALAKDGVQLGDARLLDTLLAQVVLPHWGHLSIQRVGDLHFAQLEKYVAHEKVAAGDFNVLGAILFAGVVHIVGEIPQRLLKLALGYLQHGNVAIQLGVDMIRTVGVLHHCPLCLG